MRGSTPADTNNGILQPKKKKKTSGGNAVAGSLRVQVEPRQKKKANSTHTHTHTSAKRTKERVLRVLELPLPVGRRQVLADVLELPRRHAGVGRRQHELRVRRGDVDEPTRLVVSLFFLFLCLFRSYGVLPLYSVCYVSFLAQGERQTNNSRKDHWIGIEYGTRRNSSKGQGASPTLDMHTQVTVQAGLLHAVSPTAHPHTSETRHRYNAAVR